MQKILIIIPARYASSRFPGKPLADIGGKPMIQRVYEQAKKAFDDVVVATDDHRILQAVKSFGGTVVMTSPNHQSGTDRCAEALEHYEKEFYTHIDIIINLQGDEPFIRTDQVHLLAECFHDAATQIATLVKPIDNNEVIQDPNRPKVVVDTHHFALYFSRSPIPFLRNADPQNWATSHPFYQHIGMYGYRREVLREITRLKPGILEKAESLEQLRWLENGYRIKTAVTPYETFGIDTPEDLKLALQSGLL